MADWDEETVAIARRIHEVYRDLALAQRISLPGDQGMTWELATPETRDLMLRTVEVLLNNRAIRPPPPRYAAVRPEKQTDVPQPLFEDDRKPGEAVDAYSLRKAQEATAAREKARPESDPAVASQRAADRLKGLFGS